MTDKPTHIVDGGAVLVCDTDVVAVAGAAGLGESASREEERGEEGEHVYQLGAGAGLRRTYRALAL
jgi:hypothetical protein